MFDKLVGQRVIVTLLDNRVFEGVVKSAYEDGCLFENNLVFMDFFVKSVRVA